MREKLKIFCVYCNKVWTAKMETDFSYSMGSEFTGMYDEEVSVKIYCEHCGKLVYKKNEAPGL